MQSNNLLETLVGLQENSYYRDSTFVRTKWHFIIHQCKKRLFSHPSLTLLIMSFFCHSWTCKDFSNDFAIRSFVGWLSLRIVSSAVIYQSALCVVLIHMLISVVKSTRSTRRAQTSLAEADHYSHISQCNNVEPWWWKTTRSTKHKRRRIKMSSLDDWLSIQSIPQ